MNARHIEHIVRAAANATERHADRVDEPSLTLTRVELSTCIAAQHELALAWTGAARIAPRSTEAPQGRHSVHDPTTNATGRAIRAAWPTDHEDARL